MTEAEKDDRYLLCRIGSLIGALPLKDVREIMRPLPIEPLPDAGQVVARARELLRRRRPESPQPTPKKSPRF